MAVRTPEAMNQAFADAYNSGQIDQLMALYEPDAVFAPQPGARARGSAQIRSALEGLLSLGGKLISINRYCMQSDEIAMLQGEWSLSTTTPDGQPLALSSRTAEVVRRQPDGSWLYVIDHAFGSDDPPG